MHSCFWTNAEYAKSFRILERNLFREDGRAEYNRFREAGTETTSSTYNVSRGSLKHCYSFPFFGLRFDVSQRASCPRRKTGGKKLVREAGLRIRRQDCHRAL